MSALAFRYRATNLGEGSWGHELDTVMGPLFSRDAPLAEFHADVFDVIGRDPPGPRDVGIVHSIALPGEMYAWRFAHLPTPQIVEIEHGAIRSYARVYTLSRYFAGVLAEKGLTNIAGVLLYPTPEIPRAEHATKRVVIGQRFSEEKMPVVIMQLAERMQDVEFVFVHAQPPEGVYRVWFDLAPPNVSVRNFPLKRDYYAFLAESGCGLVATLRDNFGVSALDCLAAGRPYVAPKMFAYEELVRDASCLYEPFSLKDMERAVRHALEVGRATPPWTRAEAIAQWSEIVR